MVRKRRLGLSDPRQAFCGLADYRRKLNLMVTEYDPGRPEYRALRGAVEALDDAVELITGDRRLLHDKPHAISSPQRSRE